MKTSTLFFQFALGLATLFTLSVAQYSGQSEKLQNFIGCTAEQRNAIIDAYDEGIDIAYLSNQGITFDDPTTEEFLGTHEKNAQHQATLKKVINNAWTFHRAYPWAPYPTWKISIRCDDFHGTCARYRAAAAYTVNPGTRYDNKPAVDVDTINVCWDRFKTKTICSQDVQDKSKSDSLTDYQCRGLVMLHELFHLDSLSKIGNGGHIYDLGIYYQSGFDTTWAWHKAYGPARTKALATWPHNDVGKYVVTNADNLAQYMLSEYVTIRAAGPVVTGPAADGFLDGLNPPDKSRGGVVQGQDEPSDYYMGAAGTTSRSAKFARRDANVLPQINATALDSLAASTLHQYHKRDDGASQNYCNNRGGAEFFAAPFVTLDVAELAVDGFCSGISGAKGPDRYPVYNTLNTLPASLVLEAFVTGSCTPTESACKEAMAKILSTCDTGSKTRKYGGVMESDCAGYAMGLEGSSAASYAKRSGSWRCEALVKDDGISCACTDGKEYPRKNKRCDYTGPDGSGDDGTGGSADSQQIAIASYIHPLADTDAWNRLIAYPKDKLSVLVANVVNGPDNTLNTDWQKTIARAAASGKRVLGYVRTGYLGVSQQAYTTRLGSGDLADWVAQIQTDVNTWYQLYGSNIGGIFFDEGWNQCGPENRYAELYRYINEWTKTRYPDAYTVLNPGATMPQCFEDSADTLMTFESSYDNYKAGYHDNGWTPKDARKIWHIVYNVPEGEVGTIAALAKSRGVGMLQLTNDVYDPNPYDNLPGDSYMKALMNAVSGGSPKVASVSATSGGPGASTPGGLSVVSFEYTSVTLSWSTAANAIGYNVYINGKSSLSLPAYMTKVTVGNFAPGTSSLNFAVTALGADGGESGQSNQVSSGTKTTPSAGRNIANVQVSTSGGSTTYQADILAPYAFVRLYIGPPRLSETSCPDSFWPINYRIDDYFCGRYMVENGWLFKYTGTWSSTAIPWTWTRMYEVGVVQSGYTNTWTIQFDSSTLRTDEFVIQTQGYNPDNNMFWPCPPDVDGAGRYCGTNKKASSG